MSNAPREDVECPFCQVVPPFTIKANGIKIERQHYGVAASTITSPPILSVCRRPWERELIEHMATRHRARWAAMADGLAIFPAPVAS